MTNDERKPDYPNNGGNQYLDAVWQYYNNHREYPNPYNIPTREILPFNTPERREGER